MCANLVEGFEALGLIHEALPFNPTGDRAWLADRLRHIPPYLFHVYSPLSAGFNSEEWVKSRDVRHSAAGGDVDIFERDNAEIAAMVNRHLRWWGKRGQSVNLVSWTSSLLFALQYMFHLHRSSRDGSGLDDIRLCVIDTRLFPERCFIRDMDLIQAYEGFCEDPTGLANLSALRGRPHNEHAGSFYFGEYLSQGALRVQDRCCVISASAMINRGLFIVHPLLRDYEHWPAVGTPWANEVIRLREDFYLPETVGHEVTDAEIQAVAEVASLFRQSFRLPMAASLLALRPRQPGDGHIQRLFRRVEFSDEARIDGLWFDTMPIYELLPEVNQFRDIARAVYEDCCRKGLEEFSERFANIEAEIISATAYAQSDDQFVLGLELFGDFRANLRARLANISLLAKKLRRGIPDGANSQL